MHANKVVEDPPRSGVLHAFAFVVWQGGRMRLEGGANPILQGRRHQQADRHHHQQGQDAFGLFERERGGQKLGGFQQAKAACRLGLAFLAASKLLRGEESVVECMRGQDATTVLVDERLTDGEPQSQRAVELLHDVVRWGAWAWAPSLGRAWDGADGTLDHEGGVQALRTGRQGLLRIGCTGKGRAAQLLEGCAFLHAVLQELCVHGALRLRLARRGVDEHPALRDGTLARWHHVGAIALRERRHRLGIGLGQDRLGFAQGRGDTGDPLQTRLGELLEGLGTLEGTVGDQERRAIGELQLCSMVGDDLAELVPITPIPTEGLHQQRHTGVVFDHQVQHHVVEVRALIPTGAAGDMHDVLIGLLITLVAAVDRKTRASEMRKAGRKSQALDSGRGNEAGECRPPRVVERIQSTAECVIVAMAGVHAWGNETRERFMLEKMWDEGALLVEKAQTVEYHGLDRMACGDNAHCRVLLGGLVHDLGDAEVFTHARDKAKVIQDLRAVLLRLRRDSRAVRLAHTLLLYRGECIATPKLLNYTRVVRNVGCTTCSITSRKPRSRGEKWR
jgi:hypothetical protein